MGGIKAREGGQTEGALWEASISKQTPPYLGEEQKKQNAHSLFFHKPQNTSTSTSTVMESFMTSSQQQQQIIIIVIIIIIIIIIITAVVVVTIILLYKIPHETYSFLYVCCGIQLCNFHWHINHLFNKQVSVN